MMEYTFYNAEGRAHQFFANEQQITCTAKIEIARGGQTRDEYEAALRRIADQIVEAMRATTRFTSNGATMSGLGFVSATSDFRDLDKPTVTGHFVPQGKAFVVSWVVDDESSA